MTERVHHIVVTYDIHDRRRLARVAKISKDFGGRVLMSVFECSLTRSELDRFKDRIDAEIDHMEDSVRFYFVCEKCRRLVESSGAGSAFFVEEEIIVG
ncbi:MAG: CRISPR-associated endonuclease Cas2 [Syntrophobacteraceae bacterium]|nr:CRISPR-associated endonuclease Cas2 [Syntrophobacteraceae bacterium]